jgi:hypothetical protein
MAIVSDISDFVNRQEQFIAIKPFHPRPGGVASAFLSIAPDFRRDIWHRFAKDPARSIEECRREARPSWNLGDQRWIELMDAAPHYWPKGPEAAYMGSWKNKSGMMAFLINAESQRAKTFDLTGCHYGYAHNGGLYEH